mgnify:CR=1 FL=1
MKHALRVLLKLAGKDYSIPKSSFYYTLKKLENLGYVRDGVLTEAGLDVVKNIDNDYLVYCYEKVIKCKWSEGILRRLERGPYKTLSDRLKKLVKLGLVERAILQSTYPPTVMYKITDKGIKVLECFKAFNTRLFSESL